jgi:hypothetical protein
MSDAIEMTYLDLSKRRQQQQQQETKPSRSDESNVVSKSATSDESQHQLTTQSTFVDMNELTPKEKTNKKGNRKVSTTTNDTTRTIVSYLSVPNDMLDFMHMLRNNKSCINIIRLTITILLW